MTTDETGVDMLISELTFPHLAEARAARLTEELERRVEAIVADRSWGTEPDRPASTEGTVEQVDYRADYLAHVSRILPASEWTRSMRIAIDCANGATSRPLRNSSSTKTCCAMTTPTPSMAAW